MDPWIEQQSKTDALSWRSHTMLQYLTRGIKDPRLNLLFKTPFPHILNLKIIL
jgi:hypothetical protein